METTKDLFIIIQSLVGIAFSIYMMYGMLKVKNGINNVANFTTIIGEKMDEIIPALLPFLQNQILPSKEDEKLLDNDLAYAIVDSDIQKDLLQKSYNMLRDINSENDNTTIEQIESLKEQIFEYLQGYEIRS